MNKLTYILFLIIVSVGCSESTVNPSESTDSELISGVDISSFPEISESNPTFYDLDGNPAELLTILKNHGVNTVRLRLWVNPYSEHSSFEEVQQFSEQLKMLGFKIWLTMHYSDTWADPAHQTTPKAWQDFDLQTLKSYVFDYTQQIVREMQPDYIQIGNEINYGFLHPHGHLSDNPESFKILLQEGIRAVRNESEKTKIMIHFAGIDGAMWFYEQIADLDYDIIGLSYYPFWHGKSLPNLERSINTLHQTFQKKVVIAETAYPFTLGWNDYTNNIIGFEDQILPEFAPSPTGQQQFIREITQIIHRTESLGFCYWDAELIAWKGGTSETASPWENQALFDFENRALPVLEEFDF